MHRYNFALIVRTTLIRDPDTIARAIQPQHGTIMAIDVYLQIEGIKGESANSAHRDWIELTSVHMGVIQPRSATVKSAFGHNDHFHVEIKEML